MREIKFRCFDPSTNKVFIPDVVTGDGVPFASGRDYENGIDCSDCPLMQYTGLKDRNGKEIYEGDIVEVVERQRGIVREGEKGVVKFINCGFTVDSLPPDDWDVMAPTFPLYLAPLKVIGNIYETPEQHG